MTDITAAPAANPAADAAFAAAKAESMGLPPPTQAAPAGTQPAATTADNPVVQATGADDTGAAAVAAAPAEAIQIGAPAAEAETGLEASEEGSVVVYDATGDAAMDLALGFVGKLGIKPTDPEMIEAGKGNFAFLKAKLASLGAAAQGWEQYVALGEKSYQDAIKADDARVAGINTAIGQVMDADTLGAVLAFAAANASNEEKAYFNSQLKLNPLAARIAATELLRLYRASPGAQVDPKRVTTNPLGNYQEGPAKPLTRQEYTKEVDAIAKRVGGANLDRSPEYQALNRRYAAQQN